MNIPPRPIREIIAVAVATVLVAACGAGQAAEPPGELATAIEPTVSVDASAGSSEEVTREPDSGVDDTGDQRPAPVESDPPVAEPTVSDAPTVTDARTGEVGDIGPSTGPPPGPPQCDGGSSSVFDSQAPGDVATIETNQIVEGEIEQFTSDVWRIKLCEGQVVFFDSLLQCSGDESLAWRLVTPDGDRVFDLVRLINSIGNCGGDTGPIEIPETGEWSIEVFYSGFDDSAGTYKFEVLNVPAPVEFTIALGEEVRPGQPAEGAGVIEFVGSRDVYFIDLQEGQRVFFDAGESCEGDPSLDWRLVVPDGDEFYDLNRLINSIGNCGGDTDPIEITETGTYTVEVLYGDDYDGTAPQYSFMLTDASG